ncbi:MAG: GlsB/YeaQ/YmgE family stress response membrane protein [Actinomycetota bacterium]|nr:GlsB/YeaQ/YmgE family stress response membrane protein [Actinomycetota bacterium]
MGIAAWVLLGLASGLVARRLLPGRRVQGLALVCSTGVTGALLGGWAAVSLFHAQALSVFFSVPAWLTALTGAAIFLLASRTLTGRPGEPGRSREPVPVLLPVRPSDAPR